MPEVDGELVARTATELICRGPLEVMFVVMGSVLVLRVLSVLTLGRRLSRLQRWQQMELLDKAFKSRFMLLRGASVLAGLPLKVAYYNQDNVCSVLGFDRGVLIAEARGHQVTR
jgi:hypothetical protein